MPFVEIKALPGDLVIAKNYNKHPEEWETGEVQVTETCFWLLRNGCRMVRPEIPTVLYLTGKVKKGIIYLSL